MKYFLMGTLLSAVSALFSLALWGIDTAVKVTGGIGLLFLVLSMISLGTMVSGDRARANFASESMAERHERTIVSARLFFIGLPNLIVAGCFLYFLN